MCKNSFFTEVLFFVKLFVLVGAAHYHFISYIPVLDFLTDFVKLMKHIAIDLRHDKIEKMVAQDGKGFIILWDPHVLSSHKPLPTTFCIYVCS